MNSQRRKTIADLIERARVLHSEIENVRDEEQEYFDNMPEGLQGGDKGQAAEAAIGYLEESASSMDDSVTALEATE